MQIFFFDVTNIITFALFKNYTSGDFDMTKTLLFLAIITIFSLACRENRSSGGYKHESKDIATGDVDAIKSKIAFKAGILNIKPVDTEKIIKTSFDYFRDKWKPEVNYEVDDRTGYLEILSHGSNWNINFDEDDRVAWNIGINRHIQNDLSIKVGAGEIDIDLQDCNIHRFDIDMNKDQDKLKQFLNTLRGEVVAIIPNVKPTFKPMGATAKVDFLYIVEKI